jgi:FixJ family two-component response regulator
VDRIRSDVKPQQPPFPVCVIDDDASLRTSITRLLAQRGHPVETFDSASAYLSHLPCACACRLLLDVTLPVIDGIELVRRLQQEGRHERVVLMSAGDDDALQRRIASLGAIELVRKPFAAEQLIEALSRAQPL